MMKKIISALVILLSSALFAEDGFSLYIKKDYQGAYNAFYSKFAENSADPLYSYNLGVTSEALGRKGEALYFYLQSLQSCLTLCDPIDGSPPGSPVPGILQARTLEWGAICFSNA